jgi:drug/metabolite transporter (DMT)-like permease
VGRPAPMDAATRRRLHRTGLVLGLVNGFAFFALQTTGIALSDTGFSAVVIYTQPLIVAVLARRFLRERLQARQAVGLAAGWAGVALAGAEGLRLGAADPTGYLLLLGSAAAWAVGSLIVKSAPATLPVARLVFLQNAYGVVPLAVLAVVVGGDVEWGWPLVASAAWVGSAGTAGGFALQFVLLRRGQASVVSAWIFAVPVISTAVGVAVRGERLSIGLVVGAVAVGLAIWLVSPRVATAPPPP